MSLARMDGASKAPSRGTTMDELAKLPALPLPDAERAGLYRAILTRRDTRGEFLPDSVPDETLSRLLVAAHHAPSVGYMQPWSFVVIRDRAVRRQVHDAFLKAHGEAALMFPEDKRETYRSLKLEGIMEAPINICVTCDRDRAGPVVIGRTHIPAMDLFSSVCAVQNLWLAARAEGLGIGWVSIFDNEAVQRILNIPPNIVPVAYLCLGKVKFYHPRPELESAGWRDRLPLESLVHFDQWGRQDSEPDLLACLREVAAKARAGGDLG
jgi:5,6-dimethylbenzimidazole synthase